MLRTNVLSLVVFSLACGAFASLGSNASPTLTLSGLVLDAPSASGEMRLAFDFFDASTKQFMHRAVATVSYLNGGYVATVATGALQPGASYIVAASAPSAPPQSPDAAPNSYVRLQADTPGVQQTGHINISGKMIAAMFEGEGSLLTNLNASNLATGTVPSARVSGSYTGITGVGTLTAGTWQATPIGAAFGGTGIDSSAAPAGSLLRTTAPGTWATLAPGTEGQVLTIASGLPTWSVPGGATVPLNLSGTQAGSYIIRGANQSATTNSVGLLGEAIAASGVTFGVRGESVSTSGRGVYGLASATSGFANGVAGVSDSTGGSGVYGAATATSGLTYGGLFISASGDGRGVYGTASTTAGTTYGVYGLSNSSSGTGVFGDALALSGDTFGVSGQSFSTSGRGVYGLARATSGTTYGVYGQSNSTGGSGVFGEATSASGATNGVYGQSNSTGGSGVFGEAISASGATNGVYGQSNSTSGPANGVYGQSNSTSGRGVYGLASAATGTTYGVIGVSNSTSGRGVSGAASLTSGTTYGGFFQSNSTAGYGVFSNGDLRIQGDFTATGSKAGYVTDLVLNGGSEPLEMGDVVEIIGHEQAVVGDIPVIVVRKAQTANSRAVLGPVDCAVLLTPKEESEEDAKLPARLRHETPQFHVHKTDGPIQPGGYGRAVTLGSFKSIKVDASFGAIQPGDLLVSSPNPGYAMRANKPDVGTVIGKALAGFESGRGDIPVLVQSR